MKYIVKVSALSGLSNKVFRGGDEVDETCFPTGNCEELVKQGFLEPVEEEVEEEKKKKK